MDQKRSGQYAAASRRYERQEAVNYADTWWNSYNPQYLAFKEDDCTNFVSQCLFAGKAPMNYTGTRASGWWYRGKIGSQELWSFSWAVANALKLYLSLGSAGFGAAIVEAPQMLTIGDVISYDWNGEGRYEHNAIVTETTAQGMPLVNAHTVNSRHRYWDYHDSYAWSEQTRYCFFHLPDILGGGS